LRRISAGRQLSENSAEFADAVYQLKELIARYNAAAILIHHTNKNSEAVGVERVRGSSAIAGAVWGVWELGHILKPDPNNKKKNDY
jgi:phosphoribosyl 1,2-cyclic phosphodiesterase